MKELVTERKCRICGATYTMTTNPKYKKWTTELKYINDDGKHKYRSNVPISCCPTCVATGKD
jgi:hypothetical protein